MADSTKAESCRQSCGRLRSVKPASIQSLRLQSYSTSDCITRSSGFDTSVDNVVVART